MPKELLGHCCDNIAAKTNGIIGLAGEQSLPLHVKVAEPLMLFLESNNFKAMNGEKRPLISSDEPVEIEK